MVLGVAAVVLLPAQVQAVGKAPTVNIGSTSYSGQSRPFRVTVVNRVPGARVVARLTNSPNYGDSQMSCTGSGSTWTCRSSGRPLTPGTVTVRAQSVHPTDPSKSSGVVTRSASVSSSFSASAPSSVKAGESFAVTGRFDHLSGLSDYRVSARASGGGAAAAGCSTSGTSYRCTVRTSSSSSGRVSVTVSERSSSDGRSRTVGTTVIAAAAPGAPSVNVPSTLAADAAPPVVSGTAGAAGLRIDVAVDSPSFSSVATTCTTSGASGSYFCQLPSRLSAGTHTIYVRAVDAARNKVSPVATSLTVVSTDAPAPTTKPKPTKKPTPKPTPTPVTTPTPEPTQAAAPEPTVEVPTRPVVDRAGDLSAGQDALVLLLLLGLAVVALGRPGPLSLVRAGSSVAFTDLESAGLRFQSTGAVGLGDQSGSWNVVGHEATDEWSNTVPPRVARWSPFLARLIGDGVEVRAMFGSLWWLMPVLGIGLGGAAAQQAGWQATVPPTSLVLIILVLSLFDAFSGLLAGLVYGVLVLGDLGPDAGHGFLVILALVLLWSSATVIANALRPIRRPGTLSWQYTWDRIADVVIDGLVVGWLAWAVAASFDVITGAPSSLTDNAVTVGLVAGLGVAARIGFTQLALVFWPERLRFTGMDPELPTPRSSAALLGVALRVLLFAFAGHVLIGDCWQWWAGVLLFALPDFLALLDNRTGWSWSLRVPIPVGITAVLGLFLVGAVLVTVAVSGASTDLGALRSAFVVAGLAPAVLATAETFDGNTPRESGSSWHWQLAGMAVVAVTFAVAVSNWNF